MTYAVMIFGQDVFLKITDRGAERIRIAVMPFEIRSEAPTEDELSIGAQLANIISADLAFSPFFTVLDSQFYPQKRIIEEESIIRSEWVFSGIQAIVFGSYKIVDDELKIDAKLYSLSSGKRIYRRKLTQDKVQIRRMAHAIADDVVKELTGENGIAQSQISFLSNRSEHKELYVCDYDGYAVQKLTKKNSYCFTPDWSPEGFRLAFACMEGSNTFLFLYDLIQSRIDILSNAQGLNIAPSWSPDGKKIAFVMTKDGNSEIYVMDIESKSLRRLTHNNAIDTSPTWSPNGKYIAFCSDRGGSPQIYIMDEEGANVRKLTFDGSFNDEPSWSPRGDKIAFTSRMRGEFDIAVIDITGENLTYLTSVGNNEHADWAPDGYHLVFCSDRVGLFQIYEMLWDGTQLRRITNSISDNIAPSWSPRFEWNFD